MHVTYPELELSDPKGFLNRLDEEVQTSPDWTALKNAADEPGISAQYVGSSFSGHGLKVIAYKDGSSIDSSEPKAVIFGIIADQWGSSVGFRCISAREITEAFSLFRPLVRRAASAIGVECRLRYPHDQVARPISPETLKRLKAFCVTANTSCMHPLDWERFSRFIHFCHQRRPSMSSGQFRSELQMSGFPGELSKKLSDYYAFGRSLLACSHPW
jgi:hypothetical protein